MKTGRIFPALAALLLLAPPLVRAGDVAVTLDSTNGSSAFKVFDAATNEIARIQSDGALNMRGHAITNAAYAGNGTGLTNVTAAFYAETDPDWSAASNAIQIQLNAKVPRTDFTAATNNLWNTLGAESNARGTADTALAAEVATRLASTTWAAADSTTNYVHRTGDTISGDLTLNGTNLSVGAGSGADDDYLFFDQGGSSLMWDDDPGRFYFSTNLVLRRTFYVGGTPTSNLPYNAIGTTTTSHGLNDGDDLLVNGKFELNDYFYFDGGNMYLGGTSTNNDERIYWDDNTNVYTYWDDSAECFKINRGLNISDPIWVGSIVYGTTNYNCFASSTPNPLSGEMSTGNDLYVGDDVEINGYLYLHNRLYTGTSENDQYIYFYEGGVFNGEYIEWQDTGDQFVISDSLALNGNLDVSGTLTKGGGSFKIDHPLDPTNQFLSHSFVESPDMKNVYDGIVVLDTGGQATVTMPAWFGAVNRDFRYQLTPIGAAAPNLHVSAEMSGGQFSIAGGVSGQKVSWQVTGIRQDLWANAYRIPVEQEKPADQKGTYLYPELYQ